MVQGELKLCLLVEKDHISVSSFFFLALALICAISSLLFLLFADI